MSHAQLFFGFDGGEVDRRIAAVVKEARPRLVHEFGGEKAVGIADIREIQRKALLSPGEGVQYFVIRRADQMTREAYNAILKILEEPPRGSFFLLIARSPEGIPETVLSRIEKVSVLGQTRELSRTNKKPDTLRERDDVISFFEEEIVILKNKLEEGIRRGPRTPNILILGKISLCMRLLGLLHTSHTSPRYIMDMYYLGDVLR